MASAAIVESAASTGCLAVIWVRAPAIVGRKGIRFAHRLMVWISVTSGGASAMADIAKRKIASRKARAPVRSAEVDFLRKESPRPVAPSHRSKSPGVASRSTGSARRLPSVSTKSRHRLPLMNSNRFAFM